MVITSERHIFLTEDGSHTIAVAGNNITYHSKRGAIQESRHVFIDAGLNYFTNRYAYLKNETINVFEMGFGTGLNAFLTLQFAIENNQKIFYQTIEPNQLLLEEVTALNYAVLINKNLAPGFNQMHASEWNKVISIHKMFLFEKISIDLLQLQTTQQFHIIYFDAFDPNTQPELWATAVFKKMFDLLYADGILVTYCSKSIVQKAMKNAGFTIEKLKGPPGKREIMRAIKKMELQEV